MYSKPRLHLSEEKPKVFFPARLPVGKANPGFIPVRLMRIMALMDLAPSANSGICVRPRPSHALLSTTASTCSQGNGPFQRLLLLRA